MSTFLVLQPRGFPLELALAFATFEIFIVEVNAKMSSKSILATQNFAANITSMDRIINGVEIRGLA